VPKLGVVQNATWNGSVQSVATCSACHLFLDVCDRLVGDGRAPSDAHSAHRAAALARASQAKVARAIDEAGLAHALVAQCCRIAAVAHQPRTAARRELACCILAVCLVVHCPSRLGRMVRLRDRASAQTQTLVRQVRVLKVLGRERDVASSVLGDGVDCTGDMRREVGGASAREPPAEFVYT
jgi:hypothetical protein